jgi:hypothetical protein
MVDGGHIAGATQKPLSNVVPPTQTGPLEDWQTLPLNVPVLHVGLALETQPAPLSVPLWQLGFSE